MAIRFMRLTPVLLAACLAVAQVTGRVQIKPLHAYSGRPPLAKPSAIVVYDFASTADEVKLNSAALNRIRTHVSGASADEKSDLAQKVVNDFSQTLVRNLQKTGLPVSRGVLGQLAPDHSLVVRGDFLTIDEGNRARRMAIGLGAGASKVETHVQCYLKQPEKNVIVTEFKAISQSSRKPGAAETMGAGAAPDVAAAASGATELKQGAEGDTDRMAKAVAKQITKALAMQGWTSSTN